MDELSNQDQAVELLQQLGLKEYEARSFVALSRRSQATAKQISETSEVPRTRVYDAIRVLESKGLVEIQHSSPQVFRAVAVDEAVETLRAEYDDRAETLRNTLAGLDQVDEAEETEVTHEVWALTGGTGIAKRTQTLVDDAQEEVVMVLGHEDVLTAALAEQLQSARDRGLTVVVGAVSETLRDRVQAELPDVEVFVSGLEWLGESAATEDTTEISRLVLVDREAILVSTYSNATAGDAQNEQAVFGRGFDNGLVTITRRLMATGLLDGRDEATSEE